MNLPKALYHAFSGLLGGDDYEWITWPARSPNPNPNPNPNPKPDSRILRLGVLFFVLIITSTYTANLASFFTKQGYTIHGPTSMAALRSAKAFMIDPRYFPTGLQYVRQVVGISYPFPGAARSQGISPSIARLLAANKLRRGEVDVWLDDKQVLSHYLKRETACKNDDLVEAEAISFGVTSLALAFRAEDQAKVNKFNTALAFYANIPAFQDLGTQLTGLGEVCDETSLSNSAQITIEQMTGVLFIFGMVWLCSMVLVLVDHLRKVCGSTGGKGDPAQEMQAPGTRPTAARADHGRGGAQDNPHCDVAGSELGHGRRDASNAPRQSRCARSAERGRRGRCWGEGRRHGGGNFPGGLAGQSGFLG